MSEKKGITALGYAALVGLTFIVGAGTGIYLTLSSKLFNSRSISRASREGYFLGQLNIEGASGPVENLIFHSDEPNSPLYHIEFDRSGNPKSLSSYRGYELHSNGRVNLKLEQILHSLDQCDTVAR